MAPNCTLKANLKRPISQATKSEVRPYKLINKKDLGWQALTERNMKANGGQLPPTLNIFRITFQVLILCPSIVIKPEQLFPSVIRVLSIIQEFAYPIEIILIYFDCNKPLHVIQFETVIKVISVIFQGPDNPTKRINLINTNFKGVYRVIHNFSYLICYTVLQI